MLPREASHFPLNLPDIDLLYATLIDHWSVHHHRFWTHLPVVWLAVSAVVLLLFRLTGETRQRTVICLLAVWGHLLLDSVAGDIWWLWPWLDAPFSLVTIPAIHSPWWLNFLLHWTFSVEAGITLAAIWLAWKPRACRPHQDTGMRSVTHWFSL